MVQLPATDRGLRIVLSGTYGTTKWANVMHAQYATVSKPASADLNVLAGLIKTNFASNILYSSSTTCIVTQCLIVDIGQADFTGASGIDTVSTPGNGVGASLSAQIAVTISWQISRRYRGGHPRTYIPGILSSIIADNRSISQTAASQLQSHAETFRNYVNGLSMPSGGAIKLGQFSYYHGHDASHKPILRPTPIWDQFIGSHVDQRLDSQRRRLGKAFG